MIKLLLYDTDIVLCTSVQRWSPNEPNPVCGTSCQKCSWSSEAAQKTNASFPPSRVWTPWDAAGWRLPGCQSQRWRMNPKTGNGWSLRASPSAMSCTYLVRDVTFRFLFLERLTVMCVADPLLWRWKWDCSPSRDYVSAKLWFRWFLLSSITFLTSLSPMIESEIVPHLVIAYLPSCGFYHILLLSLTFASLSCKEIVINASRLLILKNNGV